MDKTYLDASDNINSKVSQDIRTYCLNESMRLEDVVLQKAANLFTTLVGKIPKTSLGLPAYFLDHKKLELFVTGEYHGSAEHIERLNAELNKPETIIELDVDPSLGLPTCRLTGTPVWEPMHFESLRLEQPDPNETHLQDLFNRYVRMPYVAQYERVNDYDPAEDEAVALTVMRNIRQLKTMTASPLATHEIKAQATLRHWGSRARAYDLFRTSAEYKRREIRARRAEADLYDDSTKLLKKAHKTLGEYLDQPLRHNVKAGDLIRLLTSMQKAQRLALGLPCTISNKFDELENIKPVAMDNVLERLTADNKATTNTQTEEEVAIGALLKDPAMVAKVEEIVLQMDTTKDTK